MPADHLTTLVVGSGGREHALALALAADPAVAQVHAAPGNPGMARLGPQHSVDPMAGAAVAGLARSIGADLVVIGPEGPLVAGVADDVRNAGIACFGPAREAARLEGSKAFAKEIMAAAGVPTARSTVCRTPEEAAAALDAWGSPYVVKDDGLAAGKGVVVTRDRGVALDHAAACGRVVIEEFLEGPEFSVFAVCDGTTARALQPAQDFKRIYDGGQGPNTGGMGSYTPLPWVPPAIADDVLSQIVQPTLDEMSRRGTPFVGCLYVGLTLTASGPRVIEFNVRFGDPDIQPVLSMLDSPLAGLLLAAAEGRLSEVESPRFKEGAAVSVVMASAGYPAGSSTGDVIVGVDRLDQVPSVDVVHAGIKYSEAGLVTAGGRVLAVRAVGASIGEARATAYDAVAKVSFPGAQWRRDIAAEPLGVVEGAGLIDEVDA